MSAQVKRASYDDALSRLRSAQKTSRGAPVYSLYVNRPIGRRLAAGAYCLGLRPNQVTVASALFSLAGILVVATQPPTVVAGLSVAFLLALGYALDSADGQLARLRGGGSVSGEWLDHMVDSVKIVALHLSVLVGATRFTAATDSPLLLVPLFFTLVASVTFFGMILNEQLRRAHGGAAGRAPVSSGGGGLVMSVLKLPTDYGLLCVSFVLLGWYEIFFGLYSLLLVGCTSYLLVAAAKWYRDMARLDANRSSSSVPHGPAPAEVREVTA